MRDRMTRTEARTFAQRLANERGESYAVYPCCAPGHTSMEDGHWDWFVAKRYPQSFTTGERFFPRASVAQ